MPRYPAFPTLVEDGVTSSPFKTTAFSGNTTVNQIERDVLSEASATPQHSQRKTSGQKVQSAISTWVNDQLNPTAATSDEIVRRSTREFTLPTDVATHARDLAKHYAEIAKEMVVRLDTAVPDPTGWDRPTEKSFDAKELVGTLNRAVDALSGSRTTITSKTGSAGSKSGGSGAGKSSVRPTFVSPSDAITATPEADSKLLEIQHDMVKTLVDAIEVAHCGLTQVFGALASYERDMPKRGGPLSVTLQTSVALAFLSRFSGVIASEAESMIGEVMTVINSQRAPAIQDAVMVDAHSGRAII